MRYSKSENTYILAVFDSGDTVTIDVYDLDTDTKVVDGASCSEIGTTGIFKYQFSQTITTKKEYLWIMSNGFYTRLGKIVLGGWLDDVKDKVDTYLDETVSSRASQTDLDAVKAQTDKMQFDAGNNIQARINDKGVMNNPPSEDINDYKNSESEIHSYLDSYPHKNDFKADVSNLALQSTLFEVKNQTDKLQFDSVNKVKATLDGEKVQLDDDTSGKIDNINSLVSQISDNIDTLLDIEQGDWEIDANTKQMIFYDRNGHELMRFNLYDKDGNLSDKNVYRRERV